MPPSSSSSCSPPQARHYNLRPRRAKLIIKENSKAPQARGRTCPRRHDTPQDMSEELAGTCNVGQKKRVSSLAMDSPAIMKSYDLASLEECLNTVRDNVTYLVSVNNDDAELNTVFQILQQDGIEEGNDLHIHATTLCTHDEMFRRTFLKYCETPERRASLIRNYWEQFWMFELKK